MLKLLRKLDDDGIVVILPNQEIVEIYITRIIGKRVEISLSFPKTVDVRRGEVYNKMVKGCNIDD
jgi:sRNA-binding carbon storage regulator CsrA